MLQFRRQFLLGPVEYKPNEQWNCFPIKHNLFLSAHPDLQVSIKSHKESLVILIGLAIDSRFPLRTLNDITSSISNNSKTIREVIDQTYSLAGRWLVIFQDHQGTYLFTDPYGFRQVFYHSNNKGKWCGSQPEIIKAATSLSWRSDEDLFYFLKSKNHVNNESVWIGNQTIYENCYHLLPNHYLDVNHGKQIRFYPEIPLPVMDTSSIIERATSILQGIFEGIVSQQPVSQALTAGWDSRLLLAASKNYSNNIEYFIDRQGILSNHHPDVWVTKLLAKKLNINFSVKNSNIIPPGWFISLLSQNVTGARILPKIYPIYTSLISGDNRVSINGNGNETCRNWYDQYCIDDYLKIDNDRLPGIHGFINQPYVTKIINEWKDDYYSSKVNDRNVLDMLYWEQRLGNWGAQFPAEKDIAVEEFSPFNCRLLIDILLSSPRHLRAAPKYELYKQLILAMWPETLSLPINPLRKRPGDPLWKRKLRPYLPLPIRKLMRKVRKK